MVGFVLPYGFLFSNLIWLELSALAHALLWACIVAYTVGFVIYSVFCILHYNRKTKRILNFACCSLWTSHLAMVLVLMVGFVAAHNISLHRRRVGIIYIIISGGIVYSIGNAGLRYRRKYDVNVFLSLCKRLLMAGVTCISVFLGGAVSDENYISSGFAMSLVIPGFSAYFVFLWFLKNKLQNRDNASTLISMVSLLCCCFCLIPFGLLLPITFSTNFRETTESAAFLRVLVSVISFLCMLMIIVATSFASGTFLSLEKERMAKKVVRKIIHILHEQGVHSKESMVRPLFDFMYDKKDEDLMRYLAYDNAMLRALDDGRKVVLLGGTEFENRVGKRILRLCETCLKANASYVKAQKRSKDCKACELLSIYERERERLLQEQEHQFASEEEKNSFVSGRKKNDKRATAKTKEVSNFVLALKYRDSRQYDKALSLLNIIVSDNATSVKYLILRCCVNYGLSKFQASLDDAYVSHDLDEQRKEPMIMIPAILCAMEDTKSALQFVQKLRKRHPKFKKFAELAQLIQRLISLGVRKEKAQGKGRNLFRNLGQASNSSAIKSVQLNIAEFAYAICDHSIRRRFKYELLKEAKLDQENEKKLSMDSKLGVKIVGVRNLPKTNNSLRPKICIQVYLVCLVQILAKTILAAAM